MTAATLSDTRRAHGPVRAAARRDVLAGGWTDPRCTEPVLEELASDLLGVCREIVTLTHEFDDVRGHYVGASTSSSQETLGARSNGANGGGAFDLRAARNAAIGETVERYSAAYTPAERLVTATARELGDRAPRPASTALFSHRQYADPAFPYVPFTDETVLRWVDAYDLRRERAAMVPAQLCFLSGALAPDEPRIAYAMSNGLACAATRPEATARGLLELVERDPLMICWHAGLSLPLLDPASDEWLSEVLARYVDPAGLTYAVVDLSCVLGIPTALAVVENRHEDVGALALGAACRPTMADAAVEALLEAYQSRSWCKGQQRARPRVPDDADLAHSVVDFDDHVRFYGERDRAAAAAFLTASTQRTRTDDVRPLDATTPLALVDDVLSRLPEDVDVYAVDLTSPDIADCGLSVVKVWSPQLQPLDVGWRTRCLGGDRIYQVPFSLGLVPAPLTEDDLTPVPHPFP